jgi:hypothetical protein
MIDYLVLLNNGETFVIEVPDTWKTTFGPVSPGSKYHGHHEWALRFYETKDRQRALFLNVVEFRDLSVKIKKPFIETPIEDAGHLVGDLAGVIDHGQDNKVNVKFSEVVSSPKSSMVGKSIAHMEVPEF